MDIGLKIKELRKQRNLSQSELADLLCISQKTISSYERNRTQPNIEMIEEMCKVLNCKKTDFMEEQPEFLDLKIDEFELVREYRGMNEKEKNSLILYAKYLSGLNPKED